MVVCADTLSHVVCHLSLWDARSFQHAHPVFARVVHEYVAKTVRQALASTRPPIIDKFMGLQKGFKERVHHEFVLFRTPKDATLLYVQSSATVAMRVYDDGGAFIELRVMPTRPAFDALERTLTALWWFATYLRDRGHTEVEVRTKAALHHPFSEVLNTTASTFVDKHVAKLFTR